MSLISVNKYYGIKNMHFKGTVTREFWPRFFVNQLQLGPCFEVNIFWIFFTIVNTYSS
jgi:hypothetical protein